VTRKIVQLHPKALEEAEAATDWYSARSFRAAELFLSALAGAIDKIANRPEQFPEFLFGTRRMVMRKFPFVIVFRENSTLEIVAIAHSRRQPGYWQKRL